MILRAYDIGAGDEVIVRSNTFIATWLTVSYAAAASVPVEPHPPTFNIAPEQIEKAITAKTKAGAVTTMRKWQVLSAHCTIMARK